MLQQPAISGLLNTEMEKATQKDVILQIQVYDDLREIPCSVYDMNKILRNIIQNAIEEVDLQIQKMTNALWKWKLVVNTTKRLFV